MTKFGIEDLKREYFTLSGGEIDVLNAISCNGGEMDVDVVENYCPHKKEVIAATVNSLVLKGFLNVNVINRFDGITAKAMLTAAGCILSGDRISRINEKSESVSAKTNPLPN